MHGGAWSLVLLLCAVAVSAAVAARPPAAASPAPTVAPQPSSVIFTGSWARMLADPARNRMYFSQSAWGSVVVWNTSSDARIANISVGAGAASMDLSWSGNELYVTLSASNALAVVDLTSFTLQKTISLGVTPYMVAAGRPGRAYVSTTEGWGYPRIVDVDAGSVIGSITAAGFIYQDSLVHTTVDRTTLIVAEAGLSPATIYAFDVSTDAVRLASTSPWDTVGENLQDFAVSPTNPWLFIASGWPYYVQVVNYLTWSPVRQLSTGPYPSAVGLAQRGNLVFADHESPDVIAFYASNGTARGSFSFNQNPVYVQASRDGTKVYAITTDIYGGTRQVERIATGFPAASNEPPIPLAVANTTFGYLPAAITFYGGAAYGTAPYSFSWDFGDGGTATGWNAAHTFNAVGLYNVTLTVRDALAVTAARVIQVDVLTPLAPNTLWLGAVLPGEAFSSSNDWVPPDPQVAVGPTAIVEMVNLRMEIWSRSGTVLQDIPLSTLFQRPTYEYLSDPRIVYDAPSGRWFASVMDVNDSAAILAVSPGNGPFGAWTPLRLPAPGCPDQPMLGVGPITVVVSANVFSTCTATPTYTGAQIWVVNKTDLLTAHPPRVDSFGPFPAGESLHPVTVMGPTGMMYLVSVGWATAPTTTLQVLPVLGSPPGASIGTALNLSIRTVNQPPNAPQSGTGWLVNTGDARVLDAIEESGLLWITFGDACSPAGPASNQSCARVLQVDPATSAVLQDFDVGDPVRSYFYPAIRLDPAGNLIMAFSYSSPSEPPGFMAATQLAGDARNTTRASLLVHAGSGAETLWCPDGVSCRFGDYSGVSTDPADPSVLWVAGETGGVSGWQTTVASVGLSPPVSLTMNYSVVGSGTPASPPGLTYFYRGVMHTSPLTTSGQTFTVDPGTTWSVPGAWTGSSSRERWTALSSTSGTAMTPQSLTIVYEHDYGVDVQSAQSQGGSASPASGWYLAGTTIHLSATAFGGWLFSHWNGTVTGTTATLDVVVSGPLTETAFFNPGVTLTADAGGAVSYAFGNASGTVAAGTSRTLSVPIGVTLHLNASALPGWAFVRWSGGGNGSTSGSTQHADLLASGPMTEEAIFDPGLTLTASAGGTITYSFGGTSGLVAANTTRTVYMPIGTVVQLSAQSYSGYSLTGWTGNASGASPTVTVIVRAPSAASASFSTVPSATSTSSDAVFWGAVIGIPLALAIVALVAVLIYRRRRGRSQQPPAPPAPPPPP